MRVDSRHRPRPPSPRESPSARVIGPPPRGLRRTAAAAAAVTRRHERNRVAPRSTWVRSIPGERHRHPPFNLRPRHTPLLAGMSRCRQLGRKRISAAPGATTRRRARHEWRREREKKRRSHREVGGPPEVRRRALRLAADRTAAFDLSHSDSERTSINLTGDVVNLSNENLLINVLPLDRRKKRRDRTRITRLKTSPRVLPPFELVANRS